MRKNKYPNKPKRQVTQSRMTNRNISPVHPELGYRKLLYTAARANRKVTITPSEYSEITSHGCDYCKKGLSPSGHGLDRIDNSKDYHIDNVVPCCGPCNMLKGRFLSSQELRLILKHRNSKK